MSADRWNEAQLRGIVANAKKTFDGTIMPSFYKTSGFIRPGDGYTGKAAEETLSPMLSAQQIEDVVAFLMTLKAVDETGQGAPNARQRLGTPGARQLHGTPRAPRYKETKWNSRDVDSAMGAALRS